MNVYLLRDALLVREGACSARYSIYGYCIVMFVIDGIHVRLDVGMHESYAHLNCMTIELQIKVLCDFNNLHLELE